MEDKLFNIFLNKYLLPRVENFNGILVSSTVDDYGEVTVNFENPNNLSINTNILPSIIDGLVYEYSKYLIGVSNFSKIHNYFLSNITMTYNGDYLDTTKPGKIILSSDDKKKIQTILKTVTNFNFELFESTCETTFLNLETDGFEGLYLKLRVKLLEPTYDENSFSGNKSLLNQYFDSAYDNDAFIDYINNKFADNLLTFIWDNPLLLDVDYMYTTTNLDIVYRDGTTLNNLD